MSDMFCFQCQEAAKGTGCTIKGVCGKTSEVSNLQDLLIYTLKGIAIFSDKGREVGVSTKVADRFIMESLFATITNANFDHDSFVQKIREGITYRDNLKAELDRLGVSADHETHDASLWNVSADSEL
ncbi:MAG: hydroxylamine reductase, partial [Gorillibacterium sp.]|nr:hydroxylamine reductase [Gorillibacterium sp.]